MKRTLIVLLEHVIEMYDGETVDEALERGNYENEGIVASMVETFDPDTGKTEEGPVQMYVSQEYLEGWHGQSA